MNTTISPEALCSLEQKFDQNPVHTVAMNAVYTNGINACARNYPVDREITHDYSISLTQGKRAAAAGCSQHSTACALL